VVGESRAGAETVTLARGSACRIFTGGPVPVGANAVIAQEDTRDVPGGIALAAAPTEGDHVRRRGEDLARGALGLARGTRLGGYQLSLAAALDRADVVVSRRPRVSIISTGDELRAPGQPGSASSIPESNSLAIAIQAESAGAIAEILPAAADDVATLEHRLARALAGTDLLITIGGVSVGRYDLVRPALERAGAALDFWKVAIKPGKPLVFGRLGSTRILGLPGNPVSAQLTFALFGLPLVRALQGELDRGPRFRQARLLGEIRQRKGRMGFYRGVSSVQGVTPLDNQASGNVVSLSRADVLIAIAADSEGASAGDSVPVLAMSEL
jgi:molybdopterin molybdotransferase